MSDAGNGEIAVMLLSSKQIYQGVSKVGTELQKKRALAREIALRTGQPERPVETVTVSLEDGVTVVFTPTDK